MTKKEKLFAAQLLEMAGDEFANHWCNDLPESCIKIFTEEEWRDLSFRYHCWNEGAYEPEETATMQDDAPLMAYFAEVLREEAKNEKDL